MIARRDFVRSLVGGTAAAVLSTRELAARAERIALEPYAPLRLRRGAPVRVRGRVTADGRGVARVLVSDGLSVVRTDSSGAYELLSDAMRSHVMVTVPDAHEIPRSPMGTAAFYMPLAPDPRGEQRADFAIVRAPSAARHATLFLADPQTEDAEEMGFLHAQTVPDVRATVERLGVPAVGVAVGDIMFDNLDLYPDYERAVQAMGVPFYQVIGNHDLDFDARVDEASTATFSRHFGPRYYSFERGALHYVILDDVLWHGAGYIGHLGAEQLAWLANDLAHVEPGRTVIVATHIPVLGSRHLREGTGQRPALGSAVTNREALYRLLEPYVAHIITGHMHESEHLYAHGVHENVIGAICGAWWSGPICGDGTPNGYAIYEVDGESVRWTYKATGQPLDHQLRAHGVGSDPSAPTEIVANVWDADPEWAIVWYEDGDRRGAMARRVGRDPLSMEMHSGPELPPKRPWVDPYMTGHLYYAPVSPTANDVVVEATDRFGRSYTARITPRA
jgi:hypothetical protein